MAVAKDTYDHLKRAHSYSGPYSVSTLSIEDVGTVDIGTFILAIIAVFVLSIVLSYLQTVLWLIVNVNMACT